MVEERPLTNADFRQLLLTPRPGDFDEAKPTRNGSKGGRPGVRPRQQTNRSALGVNELGNPTQTTVPDPDYRDRALERRKGLPTYDGEGLTEREIAAMQSLSYEESKLLGGDLGHTHLVKGLDYALLDRIRQEQQRKDALKSQQAEASTPGLQQGEDGQGQSLLKRQQRFSTPLAKSLYQYFDKTRSSHVSRRSERFNPRRCAFIYDLVLEEKEHVPKTVVRALGDYASTLRDIKVSNEAEIIQQLTKVLSYLKNGGSKKIKKGGMPEVSNYYEMKLRPPQTDDVARDQKEKKREGNVAEKEKKQDSEEEEEDSEEDIFADAGTDYVVERREDRNAGVRKAVGPFFEDRSSDKQDASKAQTIEMQSRLESESKKGQTAKTQARVQPNIDDGYAECYPAYYEAAEDIYDSEEDDKARKPATNLEGKAEQKRNAAREAAKEQSKRDAELAKIKNIFTEKGYGNEKAFEKSKRPGKEGERAAMSVPSKKKRI